MGCKCCGPMFIIIPDVAATLKMTAAVFYETSGKFSTLSHGIRAQKTFILNKCFKFLFIKQYFYQTFCINVFKIANLQSVKKLLKVIRHIMTASSLEKNKSSLAWTEESLLCKLNKSRRIKMPDFIFYSQSDKINPNYSVIYGNK